MKPQMKLGEARAPGGARLTLHAHDGHFVVRADGQALMHSALTESEELLGALAAEAAAGKRRARVLLGGLGLGFTLRRALAALPADARVQVAELSPDLVEWNRSHLSELNRGALQDSRVAVRVADVRSLLGRTEWDVVALDVDNGPVAMVRAGNAALYDERGVSGLWAALRPEGRLLVWSAGADGAFEKRLGAAGFRNVRAHRGRSGQAARMRSRGYVIFSADRPGS